MIGSPLRRQLRQGDRQGSKRAGCLVLDSLPMRSYSAAGCRGVRLVLLGHGKEAGGAQA